MAGIDFASKSVLRVGVALLGVRITTDQILAIGFTPVVIVVCVVPLTILFGYLLSRALGLSGDQGILTGGAVSICGASAALVLSTVLPRKSDSERNLIFTVIAVTCLSTTAMVLYPLLVTALGLETVPAGIFLGGTIHDVAQVVGAGYMISDEVGDVSTLTKLMRVAMLVPVVLTISLVVARRTSRSPAAPNDQTSTTKESNGTTAGFPHFLIAFVVIAGINSLHWIPPVAQAALTDLSRWLLVIAIVGVGMKASFKELSELGWRPMLLMAAETMFLAALVLAALRLEAWIKT